VVAIDTLLVIRAGALVLLALGSALVFRIVTAADAADGRPEPRSRQQSPPPPDADRRLKRAA
jgi:hypothetical protein